MKVFSLRNLLILVVLVVLAANILWRFPPGTWGKAPKVDKNNLWSSENILPTPSNLAAMGRQWKERLETLPPEERKRSEARLREETKFFVEVQFLPPEERREKVRERIEMLMNDPGLQADWAGDRMRILAGLTPEERREILRNYVKAKKANK